MLVEEISDSPKVFILRSFQLLIKEIFEAKAIIEGLKSEADYGKQKENKLMYLFFLMHQKGYPVNEMYEEKLKHVPTPRFMEYIQALEEEQQ